MLLFRLPLADPGVPELRSPVRFLAWLARGQARSIAEGAGCGAVWRHAGHNPLQVSVFWLHILKQPSIARRRWRSYPVAQSRLRSSLRRTWP